MSNAVEVFQFPATGEQVRSLTENGEPLFVLADICAVLGITNPRNVAARLPERRKGVRQMDTPGGRQSITVVDEPGAYMVVMRSDKPGAVAFQEWLAEVATEIRRTGRYEVARLGDPLDEIELANARTSKAVAIARQERDGRIAAEAKVAELAPKAEAHEVFESADGTYSFEQVAKMLHAETGLGRNNLIKRLRLVGVLTDKNLPYQRYAHHFHVVASSFEHTDGRREVTYTTRVRATGVDFIRRKLGVAAQGVLVAIP